MKRVLFLSFAALALTACGYRAPLHKSYIPEVVDSTEYSGVRPAYQSLAALMEKDTGFIPVEGNTVTLFPERGKKWEQLMEDLDYASESIYIDHYRFCADSSGSIVASVLEEKAREGVDVRVILDKGANTREDREKMELMRSSGVRIQFFHKPKMLIDHIWLSMGFNRDHRKILILDGQTAYLGGRNIQDKYFLQWRDADIRITGPVVEDIVSVFEENQQRVAPEWGKAHVAKDLEHAALMDNIPEMTQYTDVTVQVVPESPTDKVLPIRNCFEWAIQNARKYFWFYNPYTPPPASTLQALKDAAARGVDVRWIAPANNDVKLEKSMGESLYKELLEAGIRIYEWQGEVLHAKHFMSDDYLMIMGSSNFDNLSFFLNYEVVTIVYNEDVTRDAAYDFVLDLGRHCREITLEEVQNWKAFRKLRNWFIRTFGGPVG